MQDRTFGWLKRAPKIRHPPAWITSLLALCQRAGLVCVAYAVDDRLVWRTKEARPSFLQKRSKKRLPALSRAYPAAARRRIRRFFLLFCTKTGLPHLKCAAKNPSSAVSNAIRSLARSR
jgi:hypothetical protein